MINIDGTTYRYSSLNQWVQLYRHRLCVGRCSRDEYERQLRIFFSLKPSFVRRSFDLDGIKTLLDLLRQGRESNSFHVGRNYQAHGHLTELIMAAHNRHHQLLSGAAFRKRVRHGPVDPHQMPDDALDRVIQSCRDMKLVNRCRMEKARRMGDTQPL